MEINSKLNIQQPVYYHHDYEKDFPSPENTPIEKTWLEDAQRIGVIALPFLSLYKPLSFQLSIATGSLRVVSCSLALLHSCKQGEGITYASLQTTIAVAALAGTLLAHPLGMLVTTTNDMLLELFLLLENIQKSDYEKAILNCANIVNNSLYLMLFLHGGLERAIASLAMQMALGFYHSYEDYKKGKNWEAAAHIFMGLMRGYQLHQQLELLNIKTSVPAFAARRPGMIVTGASNAVDLRTTHNPEPYTIKTISSVPQRLVLVEGDCTYLPVSATDGTVWNDSNFVTHRPYLHPGDQIQQVRSGRGIGINPEIVPLRKGALDWTNAHHVYFINAPETPDQTIARVEKVTWQKEIYPFITLGDGSKWLLSKVADSEAPYWTEGMRIMILKNFANPRDHSFAFIQPQRIREYSFDDDVVYSDARKETFVETFTIPKGEYTIEAW